MSTWASLLMANAIASAIESEAMGYSYSGRARIQTQERQLNEKFGEAQKAAAEAKRARRATKRQACRA